MRESIPGRRGDPPPRPAWFLPLLTACVVLIVACSAQPAAQSSPTAPAGATSPATGSAAPSAGSVWILPALGLDVHAQPSLTSKRVFTLACGAHIGVTAQEQVQKQSWLHVRSGDGKVDGWVVNSQQYVIDRAMSIYNLGGMLSMLYPTTWAVQSGNPAVFTAPAGDAQSGTLRLQSAADAGSLPNPPISQGTEDTSQETSVSLSGVPSQVFVFLTNGGGTEYFVERKLGTLVYLIDLQQPQSTPSTAFFLQLLTSVNAQFGAASPSPSPS